MFAYSCLLALPARCWVPSPAVTRRPQRRRFAWASSALDAHAVPWTQIITDPKSDPLIREMKVVAAVPAYSPDIPFSADNIQKNIQSMRQMGVEIADTIEALLAKGRCGVAVEHRWPAAS